MCLISLENCFLHCAGSDITDIVDIYKFGVQTSIVVVADEYLLLHSFYSRIFIY